MVVASCAVTFTLIVFAPSESDTCRPVFPESASAISASELFRYSTVALLSFTAGVIVITSTPLSTDAV